MARWRNWPTQQFARSLALITACSLHNGHHAVQGKVGLKQTTEYVWVGRIQGIPVQIFRDGTIFLGDGKDDFDVASQD